MDDKSIQFSCVDLQIKIQRILKNYFCICLNFGTIIIVNIYGQNTWFAFDSSQWHLIKNYLIVIDIIVKCSQTRKQIVINDNVQ